MEGRRKGREREGERIPSKVNVSRINTGLCRRHVEKSARLNSAFAAINVCTNGTLVPHSASVCHSAPLYLRDVTSALYKCFRYCYYKERRRRFDGQQRSLCVCLLVTIRRESYENG